eukprot:3522056-Prymnesium_polylepis.1
MPPAPAKSSTTVGCPSLQSTLCRLEHLITKASMHSQLHTVCLHPLVTYSESFYKVGRWGHGGVCVWFEEMR